MPGERVDAVYRNGPKAIFQRQAAFIVAPGRVLIFTASSAKSFGETLDALWRYWLDGYTNGHREVSRVTPGQAAITLRFEHAALPC